MSDFPLYLTNFFHCLQPGTSVLLFRPYCTARQKVNMLFASSIIS